MACPDRDKDARIITEIERRKAMLAGDLKAEPSGYMEYLHEGSINDINALGIEERTILKIQSVADGTWRITVKIDTNDSNTVA